MAASEMSAGTYIIPSVSVTIKRSDQFPIGTSVSAFPAAARKFGGKPSGPATETHVVDSLGALGPFTLLVPDTSYVAYAEVEGKHRYVNLEDSSFVEPGTLMQRVKARQEAAGV